MSSPTLKAGILVVSETASQDPSTDRCIPVLENVFNEAQQWTVSGKKFVRDDVLEIQRAILEWTDGQDPVNVLVTSGGTGFATKDHTPEVSHFLV
jgi:gephyrin